MFVLVLLVVLVLVLVLALALTFVLVLALVLVLVLLVLARVPVLVLALVLVIAPALVLVLVFALTPEALKPKRINQLTEERLVKGLLGPYTLSPSASAPSGAQGKAMSQTREHMLLLGSSLGTKGREAQRLLNP